VHSLVALAVRAVAVWSALAVVLCVVVAETTERWLSHVPAARAAGAAGAIGTALAVAIAAA
jgi:hypothetical protein